MNLEMQFFLKINRQFWSEETLKRAIVWMKNVIKKVLKNVFDCQLIAIIYQSKASMPFN